MSRSEPWKDLPRKYKQVETWQGEGYAMDLDIAQKAECSECGKKGMQWKGFATQEPFYNYHAYIVCPQCPYWYEL